ncbi:Pleckstrin homology domain-containing family A member 8 [Galdieria sulphuraria]|nr:Pleckstrin homology domain-containing family A member 8 [Galdieria sulphuraria]
MWNKKNEEKEDFGIIVILWKQVTVKEDGKVPLEPFLTAAKEVLRVVDAFGSGFRIVKNDIAGNIKKLYRANQTVHAETLQELIIAENSPDGLATVALLWLKRAFQFIASFLRRLVVTDKSLEQCVTEAYNCTLRPCHSAVIQKVFWGGVKLSPSRERFYRKLHPDLNIAKAKIEEFLIELHDPLCCIVQFFFQRELEDQCWGDEVYQRKDSSEWLKATFHNVLLNHIHLCKNSTKVNNLKHSQFFQPSSQSD